MQVRARWWAAGSAARWVGAAVGLGLLVDLAFPVDVPGFAALEHGLFRGAGAAARWWEDAPPGAWLLLALPALGLVPGRPGSTARSTLGVVLGLGMLGGLLAVGLMERSVLLGGLAAAGVARSEPDAPRRRPVAAAAALLLGAASLVWARELFAARSEGYGALEILDALGGVGLRRAGILLALASGAVAGRWRSPRRLPALLAGLAVAAAVRQTLDPLLPWPSLLGLTAAAAFALDRTAAGLRAPLPFAALPQRLLPAALLGTLLLGHTYAVRVFGCPSSPHPALQRIVAPGDVFRVALGVDGLPLLGLRGSNRIARLTASDTLEYVDPAGLPGAGEGPSGSSYATPEELLYAAPAGAFFATVLGNHPSYYAVSDSPANTVHNQLLQLDGRRIERIWAPEHLCWIGALLWHDGGLWMGCEYEPALHRFELEGGLVGRVEDPRIGDVASLAARGGRLWSAAFWTARTVAEYSGDPPAVQRIAQVGGGSYDLALRRQRLLVSSYYRSRVDVLDLGDLGRRRPWPTGLGTRALAHDASRSLSLVSAVYEGAVRACGPGIAAALPVGGHVKDIAIDEERGLAWFASRCGLWRLDLEALRASDTPPAICPDSLGP